MTPESKRGIAYVVGFVAIATAIHLYADTGHVIDGATGRSLDGVHVVGTWHGSLYQGVKSRHVCFKIVATKTNDTGRFTLLSNSLNFNPLMSGREQNLILYKPGYEIRQYPGEIPRDRVALVPDARARTERLQHIVPKSVSADCGSIEQQRDVAIPFYKEVYEEARGLGQSEEELRLVRAALVKVNALEFGIHSAEANPARGRWESGAK